MCTIGRICNRCTGFVAMTTQHKREMLASACTCSMPALTINLTKIDIQTSLACSSKEVLASESSMTLPSVWYIKKNEFYWMISSLDVNARSSFRHINNVGWATDRLPTVAVSSESSRVQPDVFHVPDSCETAPEFTVSLSVQFTVHLVQAFFTLKSLEHLSRDMNIISALSGQGTISSNLPGICEPPKRKSVMNLPGLKICFWTKTSDFAVLS